MDPFPKFTSCDPKPCMFGDLFPHILQGGSMEEVLEADDILDYERYICGFHIHEQGKSIVDKNLCPLDWYYQTFEQRMKDPNVWEHYPILDVVSPVDSGGLRRSSILGRITGPITVSVVMLRGVSQLRSMHGLCSLF